MLFVWNGFFVFFKDLGEKRRNNIWLLLCVIFLAWYNIGWIIRISRSGAKYFDNVGVPVGDPSLHPFYVLQLHFNENRTSQCHFLHLLGIVLYIIDTLTIVFCWFLAIVESIRKLSHIQVFWILQFYSAPILLEVVAGQEALGFHLDTLQQTITLELPWNKPLRSMRSASTSRAILSGLCARLRPIRFHVFPAKIQLDQVQDFLGLMYQRIPEFFTDANICLIHRFLRSLWKDQPVQSLMQWCR